MEADDPLAPFFADTRAFILSGGAARRAGGRNKSLMSVEGRLIIEHQLERLKPLFGSRITVITDRPGDFREYQLPTLSDFESEAPASERYPLRGLARAIGAAEEGWCFVLAADMPWPEPDLIRAQAMWLNDAQESSAPAARGLVLSTGETIQPFHAFYHGALAASARAALGSADRSLRAWIRSEPSIRVLPVAGLLAESSAVLRAFEGFNTPPAG